MAQQFELLPLGSAYVPEPDMSDYNSLMAELNSSISKVFTKYELDPALVQVKNLILYGTFLDDLKIAGDKTSFLEQIVDPVSQSLSGMDGKSFVKTMSSTAKDIYLSAAVFWAIQGNLSAYNSEVWKKDRPYVSIPQNAVKCAAQKGKCQCDVDSVVYYGAINENGQLDTTRNYTSQEADFHGYTSCKNDFLGWIQFQGSRNTAAVMKRRRMVNPSMKSAQKWEGNASVK